MSRWDALRPERRECATRKSFPLRRPPVRKLERASSEWQRQITQFNEALREGNESFIDNVMDRLEGILDAGSEISPIAAGEAVLSLTTTASFVCISKRLDLVSRVLAETKVTLTNHQVIQCVDNLTSIRDSKRIECLARLVLIASKQMPAEETAKELVGHTLLPVLEDAPNDNVVLVVDAVQCLVSDPLHASALLAPLTIDISDGGQEDTLTNPLYCRLMRPLQSLLRNEIYSHGACTCLSRVIKASNTTGGDVNEIDLSLLEPFFVDASREETCESRQNKAFELLRVVLKSYPTTSTGLSRLFIGDRRLPVPTTATSCLHCRHESISPLLHLLHDFDDARITNVVPCIQELLTTMPLHLWLGGKSAGLQHFGRRTSESLVCLIRVVQCRVQQCPSSIPALCPLIEVMYTRIPFSENEHDELTREAIGLLSILSTTMTHRKCPELVGCFEKCMGGRYQPQGGISPMPVPMQLWLTAAASQDFRDHLWSSLESRTQSREDATHIVCAIVRSLPSFVLGDEATWEKCRRVIVEHTKDSSFRIRLDGIAILEKLLAGRMEKNDLKGQSGAFALFASSIAWEMLKAEKPHFRTTSLNCYASLVSDDWTVLCKHSVDGERPSFQEHVNAVLSHCMRPKEANAGVRSAACKCIGSICAQFLSEGCGDTEDLAISDEVSLEFCRATCEALSVSLQDPNTEVQGKAVFAAGNLANALRDRNSSLLLLPPNYIKPLCMAVCTCLDEANGKLVNNAIRTIGHLVSLAFNPPYMDSGALDNWDSCSLYRNALHGLDRKVQAALALEGFNSSTWKQRSTANKHGWGACNSLALVLDCDVVAEETNLGAAQNSLGLLVHCIARAGSLHEKVASAATAAIRRISETTLARISDESGIVGMAMAPCLLQLYQMKNAHRQNKVRLNQELALLLRHLLKATTISDACLLLKQEDVEKNTLEFLYDWMVDEDMPLGSFEAFALALQRKDLMDDTGLQQKFASRALQLYRSANGDENDEL